MVILKVTSGPANEHIAGPLDLHPFHHLINMCFPLQLVIKADAKVPNLFHQGKFHWIFESDYFIDFPLSCKEYSLSFLRVHRQSFGFTPGVYFPVTSSHQFCNSAQVFAHHHHSKIIHISLCWVSLGI